jgi:1-acyl-sn-glycerol-3-phosphate acyltransferase
VKDRPHPFYVAMGLVMWPVVRWPLRTRVIGREHVPADGGFILVSNHISYFDSYALAFPFFPRQLHYMAKEELFKGPFGPILRAAGAFPVRRDEPGAESYRTAVRLSQGGKIVVIYPTGMREKVARRKNIVLEPHPGAARIALAARVPLVPAAVEGSERLPKPTKLTIAFGPAIETSDLSGLSAKAAARTATERMVESMAELRELVRSR